MPSEDRSIVTILVNTVVIIVSFAVGVVVFAAMVFLWEKLQGGHGLLGVVRGFISFIIIIAAFPVLLGIIYSGWALLQIFREYRADVGRTGRKSLKERRSRDTSREPLRPSGGRLTEALPGVNDPLQKRLVLWTAVGSVAAVLAAIAAWLSALGK